jgi:U3 small nucleolar RNA-associated protein 4
MTLALTPCAAPDLLSAGLRNPLGRAKGMSRVVFDEAFSRKMGWMEGRIEFGREGRLVVCRNERGVGIWRVLEEEGGWEKVLEMDLRVSTDAIDEWE